MATTLSLPSQSLNNFSSPQLKWGATPSGTVQAHHPPLPPISDIILKSSQKVLSSVPTSPNDIVSTGSHYHPAVESLEKKSTALDGRRPRIVIKFRSQSKNKTDDAVANVGEKTLVSANGEESTRDQISENKSTAFKYRVKEPSKSMEGQTLVATDGKGGSPPVPNESTRLGFVPKEKADKKKKRLFSTFSVSLNRDQIEADLVAMGGPKRIKRAKKRPKNVQKQLDSLFPGLRLKYITPDHYKVHDHHKT